MNIKTEDSGSNELAVFLFLFNIHVTHFCNTFHLTRVQDSLRYAYKCGTYKLPHVQMCLHIQTQHEFSPANCYNCQPPNSHTAFSESKKLLQQSSCMLTVIQNFGNCKGEEKCA